MARAPTSSSSGSSMSSSSSPSDDLTDGELWAISHQITMSSFVDLGHEVLGYSFDEVEEALTACELNTEKASMRLLRRWRNEQPSNKDATKDLLDRLIKAEQIEKNVRESFSVSSDSVDEHASTLRSVARDIESDDRMCAIGRELGFSESVLDRFAASNREEGLLNQVSSMTGLFDTIIQFLLTHSRSKDDTFECDYHALLQNLGKVALTGLLKDEQKMVFEDTDLQGVEEYEVIGIKLGLLSKKTIPVKYMINGKASKTYVEFFHKMAQEYCTSKFLAGSQGDLDQFMKNVRRSATPLMYADVLRFLAGSGDNLLMSSIQLILELEETVISKDIKHRLLLDCIGEARGDISKSTTDYPTFFDDGKLCLQSLPSSAVMGLGRLPPNVQKQITSVDLMYCHLRAKLTRTLWIGLRSCPNLEEMKVWGCCLQNPKLSTLPFIKRLTLSNDHSSLISAVPNVQSLKVESSPNFDNLQQVLYSVMTGLGECNGQLRSLHVSGCSGQMSMLCATKLICSLESDAPLLENLELYDVNLKLNILKIFVFRLRQIPSMREIDFQYCGTQEGGDVEEYLGEISTVDGTIAVTLSHAYRKSKTYGVSHMTV